MAVLVRIPTPLRSLTKGQIRKLASYFGISPAAFLGSALR